MIKDIKHLLIGLILIIIFPIAFILYNIFEVIKIIINFGYAICKK